nr:hypothetical protein [Tanacetum cinerariifolium]
MHAYSSGNRVRHKLVTWGFIAVLEDKGIHSSTSGRLSGPGKVADNWVTGKDETAQTCLSLHRPRKMYTVTRKQSHKRGGKSIPGIVPENGEMERKTTRS